MDEVDPAVAFFYRPHTILILCLFTCAMLYYALFAAEGAQQGLLDQTVRFGTYHYIDNAKMYASFFAKVLLDGMIYP